MTKQKCDDLSKSSQYRCFCGYIHVQTLTIILCIFFFYNYSTDVENYISMQYHNHLEVFKLAFGIISTIGPLIGIYMKKSTLFLPFLYSPIVHFFYGTMTFYNFYVGKVSPNTRFGKKLNNMFSDEYSKKIEKSLGKTTVIFIILLMGSLIVALGVWIHYVIYKCSKYIEDVSLKEDEFEPQQANKLRKKRKRITLKPTVETKPLIESNSVKKYGYAILEWLFPKKTTSPETVKQQPKMLSVTTVRNEVEILKPPKAADAKLAECFLKVQLKNHAGPSKAAAQIKLKSAEKMIENFNVLPFSRKSDTSKPKTAESMKHLKNQTNSRATNSGFVEFEVQRNDHIVQKKAASIKSIEMKLRPSLKEPLNTLSTTYFQEAYNLNCLKPKISIEVQTDESSFDQRIVENQWNSFGYNVENYSTSPRSFTPFMDNDHVTDQKSPNTASSGFASASDNTDFSPYQTASPDTEISSVVPTYVTFLFKNDETCAVEVYRNGKKEKLKNFFDNEWTPLYFSTAQVTPEIGEKAQIHCHQFPENVLYDIFKIIGKSMNEIAIDQEWKFKVIEKNCIKYFEIRTLKGIRLFPEDIVVATFLKTMKGMAENYLNAKIHEIYVATNFTITETQQRLFENAASKVHLKILSFSVNNV